MDRDLTYHITEKDAGMKIEDFLKALGCSHHVLTHLKRTEHGIMLNGSWAYASQRMNEGDVLWLHIAEETASDQIVPVALPIDIVYEDEDLMVMNKAADMPIHPSMNNYDNTLANGVMYYFASRGLPFVYRCVNRLDRDTSGLLILAKNMMSASLLYQMSAARAIRRQYLAIAEGLTPEAGTIDAPIARKADSAIMRCIDFAHGDSAVTHYERLAYHSTDRAAASGAFPEPPDPDSCAACSRKQAHITSSGSSPGLSLLRIRLETGRTHQIRVHMASIGHPLAGDFLYNPGSSAPIARQALHSCSLDFCHPITGEPLHFSCPMPEDMAQLLRKKRP